jgi:hypothetical protein
MTGRSRTNAAAGETGVCPDGHPVPKGVRFCPVCGRYVGPALDEEPWPPEGSELPTPRRRPSPWPGRILLGIGITAVVAVAVGVLVQGRGGSQPTEPPPTTVVTTLPTSPTTPPVDGQPCAAPGQRNESLWCEPTATGSVWRPAPFAGAADAVGAVGDWPEGVAVPARDLVRIASVAVGAANPALRDDDGTSLWCVSVILQNRDTSTLRYGPSQFRLLDPDGNLVPAKAAAFSPPPLTSGELLPGGTVTSYLCFPASPEDEGRYAVTYQPPGEVGRAMLYVDRSAVP